MKTHSFVCDRKPFVVCWFATLLGLIVLSALPCSLAQPTITRQPNDQSVSLGATALFSVSATGTSPVRYQWRFGLLELLQATNRSLTLANVQLASAGGYSVVIMDTSGSVTSRVALLDVDTTFVKITSGDLVTAKASSVDAAWADYTGDGYLDLVITGSADFNSNSPQKNRLYRNNGDGTFSQVTNTVVTAEARDWRFCAWADFDDDGKLDLFVTSTDANGFAAQNALFRNNGDGTFSKMTAQEVGAIVAGGGESEGPMWADYDRDGHLDLFIARYGPDWLFHSNGNGIFTQVTNTAVGLIRDTRDSYGGMWADYDNDGWPDLFVPVKDDGGGDQTNFLYHANGDGTFQRVLSGPVVSENKYSTHCGWGDYDNDGDLDLFVVNGLGGFASNSLFRNNGDGTFTKRTAAQVGSVASDLAVFAGSSWGDYDNDGWLDLLVPSFDPGTSFLYHNNGNGTFTRIRTGSVVNDQNPNGGYGVWGDYDNDGFLDLFFARGGHVPEASSLFHNSGNGNQWIKVRLVGSVSNRSAVGAKVRVKATIGGRTFWQLREIAAGVHANQLEAHFGLGDASQVEVLRIEWPSGAVEEHQNVRAKQILTIEEPVGLRVSSSTESIRLFLTGAVGRAYQLEASSDLVHWELMTSVTNTTRTVTLMQAIEHRAAARFYRALSDKAP